MKIIVMVILVASLTGCASPSILTSKEDGPALIPVNQSTTGIAAADRLYSEGEQLRQQGQLAAAAEHFERGLRIAPRSAALYLGLSRVHLAEGHSDKAQQMAQRSLSLNPGGDSQQHKNWRIGALEVVAQAKSLAGDLEGSAVARKQINKLTGANE